MIKRKEKIFSSSYAKRSKNLNKSNYETKLLYSKNNIIPSEKVE